MIAKKEGITKEKEENEEPKKSITAEAIISMFKDEKVNLKV